MERLVVKHPTAYRDVCLTRDEIELIKNMMGDRCRLNLHGLYLDPTMAKLMQKLGISINPGYPKSLQTMDLQGQELKQL